jgi:hypothetical protein
MLRDIARDCEVAFIGDLDPADLMVFAWLREQLAPTKVSLHGITDHFITALEVVLPESFRILMNSAETAATRELQQLFPDVGQLIGNNCCQILREGYKIEVEAIYSALEPGRQKRLQIFDQY